MDRIDRLTSRQFEVLSLSAQGWTNAEIADHLFLSPTTVKNHAWRVIQVLGVRNIKQATCRYGCWLVDHDLHAHPAVDELPLAEQLAIGTARLREAA